MGVNKMQFCFLLLLIVLVFNLKGEDNQPQETLKDKNDKIYFYYSNYGKIHGLFYLINESKIVQMDLSRDNKKELFQVFTKEALDYDMKFYSCKIGTNRKIFYGKAKKKELVRNFEIFSSIKTININKPSKDGEQTFKKIFNKCIKQGEDEQCVFPKLLYTSDLNNNGITEYWFVQPYLWENGLSIVEIHKEKVIPVIESCPCCD